VLKRLVSKQKPAGDYAATVVRDTGRPEVYFAFEDEADARKLAAAVKAKATGSYPGWASQWAFRLDGATVTALAASLPPPAEELAHHVDWPVKLPLVFRWCWRPIGLLFRRDGPINAAAC
jgi:hypothetical protein